MEFTGEISPAAGRHLIRVYLSVSIALVAAALGASMHVFWYPGGVLTWCGIIGLLGLIMNMPRNRVRMHLMYLLLVALWEGFSFGPGLRMSLCCYPLSIIVTVLTGAAATYGCFMGAAVMAKRREILFVGGFVSSALAYFFWLNCVPGIFGPSAVYFRVGVYVRALMFLSYFIFDTHQVLEKAHDGDFDYVRHALVITSDFLVVLAPLLVVLAKMAVRSEDAPATPPASIREKRVAARRETELKIHAYMLFACGAVSYLFE